MTTSLDRLRLLQTRIREAKGADRELDAWIIVMLTPTKATDDDLVYLIKTEPEDHCAPGTYWLKQRSGASLRTAPPLTTDPDGLGACVALMREVLPGWRRNIREDSHSYFDVALYRRNNNRSDTMGRHTLETHALLLAIIAAKISEEESSTLTAAPIAAEKD